MNTPLEDVRSAAERRLAAKRTETERVEQLHSAIRSAASAGVSEGALAEASGLTRQRVWQIVKQPHP